LAVINAAGLELKRKTKTMSATENRTMMNGNLRLSTLSAASG